MLFSYNSFVLLLFTLLPIKVSWRKEVKLPSEKLLRFAHVEILISPTETNTLWNATRTTEQVERTEQTRRDGKRKCTRNTQLPIFFTSHSNPTRCYFILFFFSLHTYFPFRTFLHTTFFSGMKKRKMKNCEFSIKNCFSRRTRWCWTRRELV